LRNLHLSIFKKIRPVGADFLQPDRHEEVAFRNFFKSPKNSIKRNITANTRHTHCTVYCHIKFGTHLQNGDVIVDGDRVVTPVIIASYHIVNSSARSMVCGASSDCEIARRHPIHRKILNNLMFF